MYNKIKIKNFRGIPGLELKNLRRFNLFVGQNNCGKTSLLESIFLLTGPTNVDLPVVINNFRGYRLASDYSWTVIFYKLDTRSAIQLEGELTKPKEKRLLIINPSKETGVSKPNNSSSHFTIKESQTVRPGRINGLSMEFSIKKGGSKTGPTFLSGIKWSGEKFERSLSAPYTDSFKGIYINPRTILEDTAQRFSEVQIKKQEATILKILQKVEPALLDISIGAENILYCDVGFDKRLPINVVGEGLNKLLSIILAIYEASGGVVLIDEIENGLHYRAQEILWKAIIEAAGAFDVQVFATTHSFENVKAYSSAYDKFGDGKDDLRLYRIEKEKEHTDVVDFNNEMLKTAIESDWEVR
ncbi:MAG: AAA family ATPase [Candidatus Aminicenantes bacterium]|nr:AAA family ATPase [Candidatus Aminicenantes bacterium]